MSTGPSKKKIIIKKKSKTAISRPGKKPIKKIKKSAADDEVPPVEPEPTVDAPAEEDAPLPDDPSAEETQHDLFVFFCPYCAKENNVTHGDVGSAVSCQSCGNTITVPPPLAEAPVVEAKKSASKAMFKFFCSICGQKLSALVETVGAKTVCPSCNSSIRVPQNQPAPPESTSPTDTTQDARTFNFHCEQCGKKFEARRSWAGRPFVCPACEAELTVPEPQD